MICRVCFLHNEYYSIFWTKNCVQKNVEVCGCSSIHPQLAREPPFQSETSIKICVVRPKHLLSTAWERAHTEELKREQEIFEARILRTGECVNMKEDYLDINPSKHAKAFVVHRIDLSLLNYKVFVLKLNFKFNLTILRSDCSTCRTM